MIERYTRPEMGKIWTPENRYQAWLRVELAVCEAWNRVGEISDADMETLRKEADFTVDRAFVDRANEIEETTRHDVIAFLTAIEEKVGPVSRFIHLGCTSSDIVDTAGSLLMVEAGELILKAFDRVLAVLKKMTLEHQGLLCMGRTHGIHAEPTSFSLKMAGFYAEFKRDRARFAAALDDMRVGKLSGAVGTYTVLSPEVEAIVCDLLGLKVDEVSTQVIQRDRHAAYFTALAVTAGTIERLCVELRHLQRTEVREVEEGFGKGQKGSSAMPHKKNPDIFELIRAKCNHLQSLPMQMAMICTNLTSGYFRDMQLTKELFLPAFQELNDSLFMAHLVLQEMEVKRDVLCDSRYAYIFSVEDVNERVMAGIPFREAYREIGMQIQEGHYRDGLREIHHTHEGSMGNLCLPEIKDKFEQRVSGWDITTVREAVEDLLGNR